jgi:hypothetical protein
VEHKGQQGQQQQQQLSTTNKSSLYSYVPEDSVELIGLGNAGDQWPTVGHFGKDTAHAPNVDRGTVLATAHQNIRRPVPQRHHLVRVGAYGDTEGSSQAKVGLNNIDSIGGE